MGDSRVVLLDRRVGSRELVSVLEFQNLKVEVTDLQFGDVAFEGNGPKGLCMIGIERKRLRDLIQSMHSGRFGGLQLPGMIETYDFSYLFVEGAFRGNPETGLLEEFHRGGPEALTLGSTRYMYREIDNFMNSMEMTTPIRTKRTSSPNDTAVHISNLHHFFNDKTWQEHRSTKVFYKDSADILLSQERDIPLVRRWAKELYGVGWGKSTLVMQHFHTGQEMANSPISEWVKIPGIGPTIANAAFHEIRGEKVYK